MVAIPLTFDSGRQLKPGPCSPATRCNLTTAASQIIALLAIFSERMFPTEKILKEFSNRFPARRGARRQAVVDRLLMNPLHRSQFCLSLATRSCRMLIASPAT